MNNIVKSQLFLCKKYWLSIMAAVLFPIVFFVFLFSTVGRYEEPKELFTLYGTITMIIVLLIVSYRIMFDYIQRIQMYEIMAGKKPHQIILGRMLVFLSITLVFLAIFTPVYLMWLPNMKKMLLIFWVICIRMTLVTIFLSPLLKEVTFVVLFSSFISMGAYQYYGTPEAFSHSVFSWMGFGQCKLLCGEITDAFMGKVICSGVIVCAICYIIGYITLKKKFDLEPHQI